MVDIFLTSIFSLTALVWWLPIITIFFMPFFIYRKIKNSLLRVAYKLERYSNINLHKFRQLKKNIRKMAPMVIDNKSTFNRVSDAVYRRLVWYTRLEIINAVPKGAYVLDIGCGNGYLAKLLKETKGARVTCCDVADFNKSGMPTVIYDGMHLPFEDSLFDVVLLSFVLHHSCRPEELLGEAKRVCRGKILIYEDHAPIASELLAHLHKTAYNYFYNLDSPVRYYPYSKWLELFNKKDLEVVNNESTWGMGSMIMPLKRAFFVLKNKK